MIPPKPMIVDDLITALLSLPPGAYLCGMDRDESIGVLSGIEGPTVADAWHDSLPEGAEYYQFRFSCVIPHVRGKGTEHEEEVPPKPKIMQQYWCRHCSYEEGGRSPMPCPRCSWGPKMKVKDGVTHYSRGG